MEACGYFSGVQYVVSYFAYLVGPDVQFVAAAEPMTLTAYRRK